MSRENVEIVRRVIDAWNRDQQEGVIRFLDPDVVFDATRRRINPKTYIGIEGMRVMLVDRDEVWEEFRIEPDEFVDGGDRIVVIGRWVGKGRTVGSRCTSPWPTYSRSTTAASFAASSAIPAVAKPSKPPGCRSRPLTTSWRAL